MNKKDIKIKILKEKLEKESGKKVILTENKVVSAATKLAKFLNLKKKYSKHSDIYYYTLAYGNGSNPKETSTDWEKPAKELGFINKKEENSYSYEVYYEHPDGSTIWGVSRTPDNWGGEVIRLFPPKQS